MRIERALCSVVASLSVAQAQRYIAQATREVEMIRQR